MKRILFLWACAWFTLTSFAQIPERIDRGVVALNVDLNSVYVGWRSLIDDPPDAGFNLYREDIGVGGYEKVNDEPVRGSTNYLDRGTRPGHGYRYRVKLVSGTMEIESPGEAYVFTLAGNQPYYSIKLKDEVTLKRIGIGDLDADGALDFVIQHPDFNVDPYYQPGYWKRSPSPYKLDAYSSKGEFLWRHDMGWSIETGTWYSPYMVFDVDQDGKAEVYAKAGEGDPREIDGHVLKGPEFLIKLDPTSGEVLNKRDWISREGYESYNYWCRNFLTVAYLDGKNPSLIMQRGTYTVIKTIALDRDLQTIWTWESTGRDEKYRGQGGHAIMTGDIDLDERDELVVGTFALDDDGTPLWYTGLGHNDGGYIADIIPGRPGYEIFLGVESRSPENGVCVVDAQTGRIIWGYGGSTFHVHGQAMIGDLTDEYPGIECYAGEAKGGDKFFLYSASGERLSDKNLWGLSPRAVWWDADDQKEICHDGRIIEYDGTEVMKIEGKLLIVADATMGYYNSPQVGFK